MASQGSTHNDSTAPPATEDIWSPTQPEQTGVERGAQSPPSPAPEGGAFGSSGNGAYGAEGSGQTPAENKNVTGSGKDQVAAGQTAEQSQHIRPAATPGDRSITEQMQGGDRHAENLAEEKRERGPSAEGAPKNSSADAEEVKATNG